jgi:uncharacterized protein YqgC (DUF456 family)
LVCFLFASCLPFAARAAESSGCTSTNTGLGATVGGLIGVFVLPGIGLFVGAAIGGGGTCAYKHLTAPAAPPPPVAASPQ